MRAATPPTFRPPRQARSERTLERILAAAEWLASRRPFDEIGVDDIVERAGTSVGAFYKRFPAKDALLPSLLARVQDRQLAALRVELASPAARALRLEVRVATLLDRLADNYRTNRPLVRALVAGRYDGRLALPPEEVAKARELIALIAAWLLECRDEIAHADARLAVGVALHFSISSLQLAVLYDDVGASLPPDRLVAELTRAVLAYLRSAESAAPALDGGSRR